MGIPAPSGSFWENQDWDPPNRLLALRICCWESQIRPRERFWEFLISGGQEPEPQVRARDEKWDFGTLVPINFLFQEMFHHFQTKLIF